MEHIIGDLPLESLEDINTECRLFEAGYYESKEELAKVLRDIIYG